MLLAVVVVLLLLLLVDVPLRRAEHLGRLRQKPHRERKRVAADAGASARGGRSQALVAQGRIDALEGLGGVEAEGEDVVLLEARLPGDEVVGEVVEGHALVAAVAVEEAAPRGRVF